jgi:hypothetical protein
MGRIFQPSRPGSGRYRIWWVSYYDRSQRREIRESSGSRSRRVALKLLAEREREAAARPIPFADKRRRQARAADGSRRGGRGRKAHGLTALRRAIQQLGARPLDQALDPASPVAQALAEWRANLTNDLGGDEIVTTAQRQVIEVAVRTRLLLDSVDSWLLSQGRVINGRTRTCFPVVVQRMRLADGLVRHLEALGLERRPAPVKRLTDYLQERYGAHYNGQGGDRLQTTTGNPEHPEARA